jgi:hypothetical protein
MKKIIHLIVMLVTLIAIPLHAQPARPKLSDELEKLIIDGGPFKQRQVSQILAIFRDEFERTREQVSPQANALSAGVHVLTWLIMYHANDKDPAGAIDEEGVEFEDKAQDFFLKVVNILLGYGALIDEQDLDGNTPLHEAVRKNHFKLVDLLLRKRPNAKLDWRNKKGKTPYDLATTDEMRALLMQYMPHVVVHDARTGVETMGVIIPGAGGAIYGNAAGFGSASRGGGGW